MITFDGTDDEFEPYEGGDRPVLSDLSIATNPNFEPSVPARVASWAAHNGCDPTSIRKQISEQVSTLTFGCASPCSVSRTSVVFYEIDGGEHTWPGRVVPGYSWLGAVTTDIEANELIWTFFKEHSL